MQKITSPRRGKRWLAALFFVASFLVLTAKKLFDYSAAPGKEKESDFVYPPNSDQVKPTTLTLPSPSSRPFFEQVGGFINDASHLNKTAIYGIVKVSSVA